MNAFSIDQDTTSGDRAGFLTPVPSKSLVIAQSPADEQKGWWDGLAGLIMMLDSEATHTVGTMVFGQASRDFPPKQEAMHAAYAAPHWIDGRDRPTVLVSVRKAADLFLKTVSPEELERYIHHTPRGAHTSLL